MIRPFCISSEYKTEQPASNAVATNFASYDYKETQENNSIAKITVSFSSPTTMQVFKSLLVKSIEVSLLSFNLFKQTFRHAKITCTLITGFAARSSFAFAFFDDVSSA